MNDVIGLGYIGLAVSDLDWWERFGVDHLGLQLASREPGKRLTFRMDDHAQRVIVEPGAFAYTQDARNDHMVAVIEALGVGPVNMVGNSMGGATTIGVAVNRPDLLKKAVLMGAAGIKSGEMSPALASIVNYDFTREGMVEVCQALANATFEIDPDMVEYRLELSLDPATCAAYSATMGWVKEQGGLHYEHDFIRQVKIPCLVVNGKDDKVVPLSNALKFLELIDNSWGYIIPHCGHWEMLEYPAHFAGEVTLFLRA
jgi:2-hydroxy-6-oxo-6-(2'-aminophenyl)hexa-2,4-dienoate hydrolase